MKHEVQDFVSFCRDFDSQYSEDNIWGLMKYLMYQNYLTYAEQHKRSSLVKAKNDKKPKHKCKMPARDSKGHFLSKKDGKRSRRSAKAPAKRSVASKKNSSAAGRKGKAHTRPGKSSSKKARAGFRKAA